MADVVPIPRYSDWDLGAFELIREWNAEARERGEIPEPTPKPPLRFPESPQQLRLPFDILTVYVKSR